MKSSILILGAAAASVLATPTPDYEVHERRDYIPSYWIEGKRLDSSASLPVRIGLAQNNLAYGHELLMEMYVFQTNTTHRTVPTLLVRRCLHPEIGLILHRPSMVSI